MKRRNIVRSIPSLVALSALPASALAATPDYPPWDPDNVYESGDRVTHDDAVWEAKWWTKGDEPGASEYGPWKHVSGGDEGELSAWEPDEVYLAGEQAIHDDYVWEAKWWTKGDEPGERKWGPWAEVRPVDDDPDDGDLDAAFTVSPPTPAPGESMTVDASTSTGEIASYEWTFGDGDKASGETTTHTYDGTGTYDVTLTVTSDDDETDDATRTVTVSDDPSPGDERVVGYYMQWSQWDREYYPGDIPLDQVSHVNYAFLTVEEDGTVDYIQENAAMRVLEPESWHDHTGFDDLVDDPDTKFLFSIGGWTDSKYFSNAAQTEASRTRFAESAVEIMREHDFDGIDVDWEYPGGGGKSGNIVRDGDQERYTKLLERVREELDDAEAEDDTEYLLTAALSADPQKNDGLDHAGNADVLDFLNVMTYDFHGTWNTYTNHHAPLYGTDDDPSPRADDFYVDAAMTYWANTAFDPGQLSMGLPFYGRTFGSVTNGENDGLYQPFDGTGEGTWGQANGIVEYWDVAQNLEPSDEYDAHWDDEAAVPWLYSPSKDVLVSYESERSARRKVEYAAANDVGGVMFWSFAGDKNGVLLDAITETL